MQLSTPIAKLSQVGPAYQKRLKKLGIKTIRDLLYHFPHRYEDFSNIIPISQVRLNETCCIKGRILEIENIRTWKKRMILTQAIVEDKSGAIKVVWFNQPYLTKVLKPGDNLCLAGKITFGDKGLYLSNPAYEKISQAKALIHTGRIVPVYPETEGLSSRWLRFILKPLLVKFKKKIPEPLPEKVMRDSQILPIQRAIWQIHFPDSLTLAKKAQKRFSFEELFFISLFVLREKLKISKERAISIPFNLRLIKNFIKSLPFELTDAQKKSAWQILKDLEKPRPMNRLLEGDVGSGKTVVAVLAALNVVRAGFQAAFMAPTEILAKQHFQGISKLLKKFNLNIGLLTGKENKIISKKAIPQGVAKNWRKNKVIKISREKLLEQLKKGEIDLLIGTHALIQERVRFGKLALVVLDEQHRFGVEQRAKLATSNKQQKTRIIPHLLSMTATPIPRTLALTIYGDLDLSLIDELPRGRKKIVTKVISPENRQAAYDFIRSVVKKRRQVFVICPRIEPSDKKKIEKEVLSWAEVRAVKEEYQKLSKIVFPDLKVGMIHGKMTTKEKEEIMKHFSGKGRKDKKIDILVSTSVIEVGIDVPNATVMMIEGAERFGLAQLHQFRGRVGRSKYQSFCFLFTDSPAKKTHQRLKALISSENGFELAEKDLKIRGPGDFLGQRQWGIPDLAMSALKDIFLVEKTRKAAKEILEEDPELKKYPSLRERLEKSRERIHLE
ncbi:ATP-dependent DNA helicase RecG [Patescibacteria group bacterium]|nr:ATP-dependent DNA helicase RecG [Patescibacteria group bacterium]